MSNFHDNDEKNELCLSTICVYILSVTINNIIHSIMEEVTMPLFLDIHKHVPGLTTEAVKGAHAVDLETQGKHDVQYLEYWYDEGSGKVFCLVQAPNKEAAIAVHREGHGLLADEIFEVKHGK